jgi:hypothetical protein
MASNKQGQANKLNTKKSTGPRTELGKARSSRNSLKHGLTSREIVIGDEDSREFDELREGLMADFRPATTIESELVHRLAALLWRLRRVPVFEAALMRARLEEIEKSKASEKEMRARIELELLDRLAAVFREHPKLLLFNRQEQEAEIEKLDNPQLELVEALFDLIVKRLPTEEDLAEMYRLSLESPELYESICAKEKKRDWSLERGPETGLALIRDSENSDTMGKLSRYEAGLLNGITRTLSLLHSLQGSGLLSNKRIVERPIGN